MVGATKSSQLEEIRQDAPGLFLLLPGVGAQGGSLEDAVNLGVDALRQSALINVSRALIYPSGSFASVDDYEEAVSIEAINIWDEMKRTL